MNLISPTLRKLHNSNRIPRSCSGTFFLVAFFSAATRHAGVLSSSRLLRASSGHLFQMLSWPGPFLSKFFHVFGDSIQKRCKGVGFDSKAVQGSALCRSRRELSHVPFLNVYFRIFLHPDGSHENGFWGFDSKTVQRSALCRSRRELSNECLLA